MVAFVSGEKWTFYSGD